MSVRLCNLGSGSGGNCTLVESENARILVDAARLGQRYIVEALEKLCVDIRDIDAVLATHMHGDHIDGGVTYPLCKKYDIPLYVHHGSHDDLLRRSPKFTDLENSGLVRFFGDETFQIRERVKVTPFHVNHGNGGWNRDTVGRPVGFRITFDEGGAEKRVAITTDLGEVLPHIEEACLDSDILFIESNHDPEMERRSSRPLFLVKWVLSPRGHLSNEEAAGMVSRVVSRSGGKVKHIFLAHLSAECNTPELAFQTARAALDRVGSREAALHVASQNTPSAPVVV